MDLCNVEAGDEADIYKLSRKPKQKKGKGNDQKKKPKQNKKKGKNK